MIMNFTKISWVKQKDKWKEKSRKVNLSSSQVHSKFWIVAKLEH